MSDISGLFTIWQNAQSPMSEVVRWGNFPEYNQTLTEHSNSVPLVGIWMVAQTGVGNAVDFQLLTQALLLHDHGEPLTGGDEHVGNKTAGKERREWEAFAQLLEGRGLPSELQAEWRHAFLLQYCRKPYEDLFEEDLAAEIEVLHGHYWREAAMFDATERLDYLLSAYAGHLRKIQNQEETMIEHTLKRQVPALDRIVQDYDPLGKAWTPELRQWFLDLA